MIEMRPRDHLRDCSIMMDDNDDGTLTVEEFYKERSVRRRCCRPTSICSTAIGLRAASRVRQSTRFAVDRVPDPPGAVSPTGRCATAGAAELLDRVRNGTETDVDCGGSCGVCEGTEQCAAARPIAAPARATLGRLSGTDLQRRSCVDGVETDVDCGNACSATGREHGKACIERTSDCTSGHPLEAAAVRAPARRRRRRADAACGRQTRRPRSRRGCGSWRRRRSPASDER